MNTIIDADEVRASILELHAFTNTDSFRTILSELWSLPPDDRVEFVARVLMKEDEMARRGVKPPPGISIQRSTFADGRPTLFCISKHLSDGKRKVTITFDNSMEEAAGQTS